MKELWTDDQARQLLAARQRGETMPAAAASVGKSKNAAIGFLHRAQKESEAIPCECKKRENKDSAGWRWAT